jgi:hypothetical protein
MSNNRQIFHISAQIENGITLAAEVGLLSRNIKIEGADYINKTITSRLKSLNIKKTMTYVH